MKVLVSAYACSPYKGSEPGVGWGFIKSLSHLHELYVITDLEFKADIEHYLSETPCFVNAVFHYIPRDRWITLERIYPPAYYWTYQRWHQDAFALAQKLHREIGFDLAHQLTMVGFREPGYLWKLGIPFVWGPVGGMGLFPWRFLPVVGGYGALYYLGYNLFNAWQMRFSRRPKLAASAAGAGLIAATPENQAGATRYWACPSTVISEVGLPHLQPVQPVRRHPGEPLRLVWTGLHIPGKALNLALAALAQLPKHLNWELHVLGKGARTARWQLMAQELGLTEWCRFHGWLPRDEALRIMAASHVMLITSLRDLTSTVTIEALAMGLPIVCLDHCGFAGVVDDTCGIKVPVRTPAVAVAGLAAGMARLAADEDLRFELAQGAVLRAQDFSWEKKAEAVDKIYQRVVDERRVGMA